LQVSVVIPTRDSILEKHAGIGYVLQSLQKQTGVEYEVIVVDQSVNDRTEELVRRLECNARVLKLKPTSLNPALARNKGAAEAASDLIVFLDDDTVLGAADTLRRTVEAVHDVDFACGAERFWTSVNWWRYVRFDQPLSATLATLRQISILPRGINPINGFRDLTEFTFIGNFGIVRREAFAAVGGFDVGYEGWGMEDTDLMMRLCLAGRNYSLLSRSDVRVFHLGHGSTARVVSNNLGRFNDFERRTGKWFHVNHFFEIYEADGYGLFSPV
jgi:glycosyltransferase involved in cell wall biosynthesis